MDRCRPACVPAGAARVLARSAAAVPQYRPDYPVTPAARPRRALKCRSLVIVDGFGMVAILMPRPSEIVPVAVTGWDRWIISCGGCQPMPSASRWWLAHPGFPPAKICTCILMALHRHPDGLVWRATPGWHCAGGRVPGAGLLLLKVPPSWHASPPPGPVPRAPSLLEVPAEPAAGLPPPRVA